MPLMKSACKRARGARFTHWAMLLVACVAGASGGEMSGTWQWDEDSTDCIQLYCQSSGVNKLGVQHLEAVHFPPFNRTEMQLTQPDTNLTMLGAKLQLYSCPWPRGSLADALAALQYPVAELQQLEITEPNPACSPRAEHFTGLHLMKLTFTFNSDITNNTPHLNPDIFTSLTDLIELESNDVMLSPMPTTSRLKTVTLRGGRSTGAWGGCAELRELTLNHWEVPAAAGEGWLAHCPQLSTLRAQWLTAASLVWALRGARALTSLEITDGEDLSPMELESMLSVLPLQQLALPYEMFKLMSENILSTSLEKLTLYEADWTSGDEEKQGVVRRLARLPELRELDLNYNTKADICELFPENGSLPALRRLSLASTATKKLCFGEWNSLEYLDLTYSDIRELELLQLPRAHPLLVDLRGTAVRDMTLDEASYNLLLARLNETANVTILWDVDLDCDCEHAWVARALRTLPLSVPGARCYEDGASLSDAPAERLECDLFECGQCTCRRAWRDNATTETCVDVGDVRERRDAGAGPARVARRRMSRHAARKLYLNGGRIH